MPTLIYSPGIRVYISTEKHGVLDVSDDVTGFTMVRRVDGISTFDFSLMNARRKYDGVFTPNDRLVVFLKRVTWLLEFTGYLNTVPIKTIWPTEVPLSSSCSLKKLQYWAWDPAHPDTQNMIAGALATGSTPRNPEGGVFSVINSVLEKVAKWPTHKVHIGKIPQDWLDVALRIAQTTAPWVKQDQEAAFDYLHSVTQEAWSGGNPLPEVGSSSGAGGDTNLPASLPHGGSVFSGMLKSTRYAGVAVSTKQRANAEVIMSVGWSILVNQPSARGHEAKAMACALATSMVETGLLNLPSKAYPDSISYPHDTYKDGSIPSGDHDSVGLFQQRAAWGTIAERMNPATSAAKFFRGGTAAGTTGLLGHSGWQQMSIGALAQDVQVSAYPDRYAEYAAMGLAMVQEGIRTLRNSKQGGGRNGKPARGSGDDPRIPGSGGGTGRGVPTNQQFLTRALALVREHPNIPYGPNYDNPAGYAQKSPRELDCSSFVQCVMFKTAGNINSVPRTSSLQAAWCQPISVEQALSTPGALVFKSTNGKPSGVHHVEVALGRGSATVGAHHPGRPAGVGDSGASYWDLGGLMQSVDYIGIGQAGGPSVFGAGQLSGGTGVWPVAAHTITTPFKKPGDWAIGFHTGVDFGNADTGDRVQSVDNGKVVSAGTTDWGSSYGNHVVIQYGDFQVGYCHLSSIDPAMVPGAQVDMGQKIGEVGDTGRSFGAHLHFEVRKAPYAYDEASLVDPEVFILNGLTSETSVDGSTSTSVTDYPFDVNGPAFDWPLIKDLPSYDPQDEILSLFGDMAWVPAMDTGSPAAIQANSLVGAHALLNDQFLLPYVKNLFYSIVRSFCSAPNGDLIAWFPDYYGLWGTAAVLRLEPIEIKDFNVFWSDDSFVTHQFAQAGTGKVSLDVTSGLTETYFPEIAGMTSTTVGIANIDIPALLEGMFGVEPADATKFAGWVYKKFGARPNFYRAEGFVGPKAEFFAAIHMFMIQWAYQYRADIPLTFMPEAWPGMLIQVKAFDFQAYITAVTHTGTFGEGGTFETNLNISSPAYMPRGGQANKNHALFGLPLAGGYAGHQGVGELPGAYDDTPDEWNDIANRREEVLPYFPEGAS